MQEVNQDVEGGKEGKEGKERQRKPKTQNTNNTFQIAIIQKLLFISQKPP